MLPPLPRHLLNYKEPNCYHTIYYRDNNNFAADISQGVFQDGCGAAWKAAHATSPTVEASKQVVCSTHPPFTPYRWNKYRR